ncbi:hypothetical protein [Thermoleophilum album]|uniref:ABC-2 type transport system permease protein n=1 Tax=Thermoleophilum album TaxID=29539 RepID=A0A1H6G0Q5_THEAL|nr:hypothetical protein [Thermoleophilum album]SEH16170.1 hypothetical protein SAMN02745716_2102 [Thermoleophilum album]
MSAFTAVGSAFAREHLRAPLTLTLLVAIPALFVLIFASVLGDFARALGGTLAERAATAISAGWAAAFLSGSLAFFELASSRGADRRLALAGLGPWRVAAARLAASLTLGVTVSAVALGTLWLESGIEHPAHAAVAVFAFAAIYIGVGALVGALVSGPLEGSLLVVLVFVVDVFSGPAMTSDRSSFLLTPTREAADLLIAAGGGRGSPGDAWLAVGAISFGALVVAVTAFWLSARSRV